MQKRVPTEKQLAALRPIQKGEVRNPTGRPKTPPDVKEALAALLPAAVTRLGEFLMGDDRKIAMRALEVVLERNLGKAVAQVDVRMHDVGAMHLQLLEEIRARRQERIGQAIDVTPRVEEGDTDKVSEYDPSKPND